jgi:uncharacterized protein (TIGR03435 family)
MNVCSTRATCAGQGSNTGRRIITSNQFERISTGETALDQTGLSGIYDFDARWTPNAERLAAHRWYYLGENPPDSPDTTTTIGASLEEALEHELGLDSAMFAVASCGANSMFRRTARHISRDRSR